MPSVKRCGPALCVLALVAALAACGGGSYSDKDLGTDLTKALGAGSPLVCWHQKGTLGGQFNHAYNRVCGALRTTPSVFIDVSSESKHTWCALSPRLRRLPVCPN